MIKYLHHYIFFALTCLIISASLPVVLGNSNSADQSSEQNIPQNLSNLENRFFDHDYNQDTESNRLTRLEQFIFGSSQSGSTNERLQHILSTIPAQTTNDSNKEASTNTSTSTDETTQLAKEKSTPDQSQKSKTDKTQSSNKPFDYGSYPRVNALEQELLGHTYSNDPLSQRLDRLEKKAFGKPSNSSDLAQRVDSLDEYTEQHDLYGEHKTSIPPTGVASSNFQNMDSFNASTENLGPDTSISHSPAPFIGNPLQLVTMMEAQVFDHTYPNRSLSARVKKLEKKVLNTKDHNGNLSDRIAKLWNTLHPSDKTGSSAIANQSNNNQLGADNATPYKNGHHSWLHKLASTAGGVATAVARSSMGGYGMGMPMMGGYGMGMPTYGYGMGMPTSSYSMGGYGMNGYGMGGYGMGMPMGMRGIW